MLIDESLVDIEAIGYSGKYRIVQAVEQESKAESFRLLVLDKKGAVQLVYPMVPWLTSH